MGELRAPRRGLRVGFLVNPFAGAGGPAALKGSDDLAIRDAVVKGAIEARAPARARQFLDALAAQTPWRLVAAPGAMGADCLHRAAGGGVFEVEVMADQLPAVTGADDTRRLARAMLAQALDLLVFVGGDGTARDVCSVLGERMPVLGVPAGVKMHSGVFAVTPQAAARVLDELAAGRLVSLMAREVRDIDEAALPSGVVKSRYYGCMRVPEELQYIQSVKHGGVEVDELVLADIAAEIKERLEEEENRGALVIFATGSTTQFIQTELAMPGTLLGVDVSLNHALIARDVDARALEKLVARHRGKMIIILTAIGGQGHIIGRGNQQLSPAVLRAVGRDNLWVVMTKSKLKSLASRPLLMDSNDPELDHRWRGLIAVITGYRDQVLYRLGIGDGGG